MAQPRHQAAAATKYQHSTAFKLLISKSDLIGTAPYASAVHLPCICECRCNTCAVVLVHCHVKEGVRVYRELMNNPDAMRQMLNPENMQAMMQMQQAMQRLQGTGLVPPAAGNGSMAGQPHTTRLYLCACWFTTQSLCLLLCPQWYKTDP